LVLGFHGFDLGGLGLGEDQQLAFWAESVIVIS